MQDVNNQGYILQDQNLNNEVVKFDTKAPGIIEWIIILSLVLILSFFLYVSFGFVGSTITILIVMLLAVKSWDVLGSKIVNSSIDISIKLRNGNSTSLKNKILGNILSFIGLKFDIEKKYFIEGYTQNLKMNGITSVLSVISDRGRDTVSASFGTVLLLLIISRPIGGDSGGFIFGSFVFIGIISPILIFWIIPLIWTIEDAGLYEIDTERRKQRDISDIIKGSALNRFLGFAGLIGSYSYIITNVNKISEYLESNVGEGFIEQSFYALFLLIGFLLFVSGIAVIVSVVYLIWFHPKRVNELRKSLVKNYNVKIGITSVREANSNERLLITGKNDNNNHETEV